MRKLSNDELWAVSGGEGDSGSCSAGGGYGGDSCSSGCASGDDGSGVGGYGGYAYGDAYASLGNTSNAGTINAGAAFGAPLSQQPYCAQVATTVGALIGQGIATVTGNRSAGIIGGGIAGYGLGQGCNSWDR